MDEAKAAAELIKDIRDWGTLVAGLIAAVAAGLAARYARKQYMRDAQAADLTIEATIRPWQQARFAIIIDASVPFGDQRTGILQKFRVDRPRGAEVRAHVGGGEGRGSMWHGPETVWSDRQLSLQVLVNVDGPLPDFVRLTVWSAWSAEPSRLTRRKVQASTHAVKAAESEAIIAAQA